MSYLDNFLDAIIENKDKDSVERFADYLIGEITDSTNYRDYAEWLDGKLDKNDVEFNSSLLGEVFRSPEDYLFRLIGIDEYYEEQVYENASLLMKYNEYIGLPGDWEEKLEQFGWLEDFRSNYKKIADLDSVSGFDIDLIKDIIDNQKYDVMNKEQAKVLSRLVYYNSSDKNNTFSPSTYPQTRMLNQIALNSDLDDDIMDAIENGAAGWYAEDIESQLEKVDMADFNINMKKEQREHKNNNRLTEEVVEEYKREWNGVLTFDYR